MMGVFLFRHGAVYNPNNILYGRSNDFTLSPEGEEQVLQSGGELARLIDVRNKVKIISSPLKRTVDTANILANIFNIEKEEIITDVRLIEPYNRLEGTNMAGGKNIIMNPSRWKYLRNPFKPSWGEPYVEIAERMESIVGEASQQTGTSILVSHELPIFITKRLSTKKKLYHMPSRRNIPTASFHKAI